LLGDNNPNVSTATLMFILLTVIFEDSVFFCWSSFGSKIPF